MGFLFYVWWLRQWRIHLQCKRLGFDPWVKKIPWRREWLPTPVFLPVCVNLLQSCPTLCDPMDHSLRGSSVHGTGVACYALLYEIFPTQGWLCISYVSYLWHWQVGSLPLVPPGKPWLFLPGESHEKGI